MARDIYHDSGKPVDGPARHAAAITPSDATDLDWTTRAIYVGGAGNLRVVMLGGETVTLTAVPVGTYLPIRVKRVLATSTTATLLIALW